MKTISKTLLSAFSLFGVGYKVGNMTSKLPVEGIKNTVKSIKEVGSQCNPHL